MDTIQGVANAADIRLVLHGLAYGGPLAKSVCSELTRIKELLLFDGIGRHHGGSRCERVCKEALEDQRRNKLQGVLYAS